MYSRTLRTALILLATGFVALVASENTLSDEFTDTPESAKVVMRSVPSSECGTSITRSCACHDGLYITKVTALLQQPDSGCSDSDKINLFHSFLSQCPTLKLVA